MKVAASLYVLCAGCLIAFGHPRSAGAQLPLPSQAQAALQQAIQQQSGLADVLRARIRESGLSAEQVRTRLRASGYAANLLDSYLGGAVPGQTTAVGAEELAAIQALGLPPITGEIVNLDTGLVRR